jgi:hypothetical protein
VADRFLDEWDCKHFFPGGKFLDIGLQILGREFHRRRMLYRLEKEKICAVRNSPLRVNKVNVSLKRKGF